MKKILIIDDDFGLRNLLETLLEDYDVIKASDAKEARIILNEPVDLAIVDIMLPEIDGYTICREIKQKYPNLPVLILTAKHQIPDLQPAIDAGADEYLTKPFDSDYLLKRIKVMVEKIGEEIPDQGKLTKFGGGFHYIRKS